VTSTTGNLGGLAGADGDRIGTGPWYNASRVAVANTLAELHARTGDASLFLDERGQRINGQWTGSPAPVEHDILTGSNADGTVATGLTSANTAPRGGAGRFYCFAR
jgi:hypothetical protein